MQKGYTNNLNFKIAFTGMMLGLTILFQYFERMMPFLDTYMHINLSLVFIMASMYVIGFRWSLLLLLLRFVIGPSVGSSGYQPIGMWSHFILFTTGLMFMTIFYTFHKYLFKSIKSERVNLLVTSISSVILVSLIAAFLNGLLFTPVYWKILNQMSGAPTVSNAKAAYPYIRDLKFFGIRNYWAGMFAVYTAGNAVKYSIIAFSFIALWKVIKHYEK